MLSTLLLLFASTTFALNWQDKEWKKAGCPQSGLGSWQSDMSKIHKNKLIYIDKDKITSIDSNNSKKKTFYQKKYIQIEGKFIVYALNPVDLEKQEYLKIRPHLVSPLVESGDGNQNSYNCLIKVFKYTSSKNATFDKYSSWEIYKLKK